jgi:hypothetical protein
MSRVRRGGLLICAAIFAVACGGGTLPTVAPATESPSTPAPTVASTVAPATDEPTPEVTAEPTVEATAEPTIDPDVLDPGLSDAGVVGRVTITGDSRLDVSRDGTYDVIGVAADGFGSDCSYSFDGEEFTAVAYNDSADSEQIRHMAVTVAASNIPEGDETVSGIEDGRVYMEFMTEEFFGSAYRADTADDDRTSVTINVTRSGDEVTFDYSGFTWDQVDLTGSMVCGSV